VLYAKNAYFFREKLNITIISELFNLLDKNSSKGDFLNAYLGLQKFLLPMLTSVLLFGLL